MRTLTNKDYKLFEQLVSATQKSMHYSMKAYLMKKYDKIINTDKYLVAIGNIPIALVAHMDTVFSTPVKELYYDRIKNVMWSPNGLGADDRAGIFAIIKIIQSGFRPSIIFTTDEEIGGIGSSELAKIACPIPDLKYMIQLDRCNTDDCVFYCCDNDDFVKYIESFGFIENIGSFSDISNLMPAWKVCGVNLSVGYRDEHSKEEVLFVEPLLHTIEKVKNMLRVNYIPDFEYKEDASANWMDGYYKYLFGEDYDNGEGGYVCGHCGKAFHEYEVFPVKAPGGTVKFYCPDCIASSEIGWCDTCGEPYIITDPTRTNMCDNCALTIINAEASNKND